MLQKFPQIAIDDDFVKNCLGRVSKYWPHLESSPIGIHAIQRENRKRISSWQKAFFAHYGVSSSKGLPLKGVDDLSIMSISLNIIAKVLGAGEFIADLETLIRADWIAHVEIGKKPRYRDHIVHPARVTAVGWWLLHRNRARLLERMAKAYRKKTKTYCRRHAIDIKNWWQSHPKRDVLSSELKNHAGLNTPGYRNGRIGTKTTQPWMAVVQYAWLACGLLHDLGYAPEIQLRAGQNLYPSFGKSFPALGTAVGRAPSGTNPGDLAKGYDGTWFGDKTPHLRNRLENFIVPKSKTGMLTPRIGNIDYCHALIGGVHLAGGTDNNSSAIKDLVVQLAARAVVTHHDKDQTYLMNDELAKLLYIADNLQGWGRPVLHREIEGTDGVRKIRPIVECERIILEPSSDRYVARFHMNEKTNDWKIIKKKPYKWRFEKFKEYNEKIEALLKKDPLYPDIILMHKRCIQPQEFRKFMEKR